MLLATVLVATVAILGVKADFNSLYINSSTPLKTMRIQCDLIFQKAM